PRDRGRECRRGRRVPAWRKAGNELVVEMRIHVGGNLLTVRQRAERRAIELGAIVARDQHLRDQAIAVVFDRTAERTLFRRHDLVRGRGLTQRREATDLGGGVVDGGGGGVRRAEQRLLAARLHDLAGDVVEASESRQRRSDRGLRRSLARN